MSTWMIALGLLLLVLLPRLLQGATPQDSEEPLEPRRRRSGFRDDRRSNPPRTVGALWR